MLLIEFAILRGLVFRAETILALDNLYGDSWLYTMEEQHMNALLLMLSLSVSRCAGRILKPMETHIKTMPAALVFATILKHVDSVVLLTHDSQ